MSKFLMNQEIAFGKHTMKVVNVRNGRIHARCIEGCCSGDVRVAIAALEDDFEHIVDAYNYEHAHNGMKITISEIAKITGISQIHGDENPEDSWEFQSRAMEH